MKQQFEAKIQVTNPEKWEAQVLEPLGVWENNVIVHGALKDYNVGEVIKAKFEVTLDTTNKAQKRRLVDIIDVQAACPNLTEKEPAPAEKVDAYWSKDNFYIEPNTHETLQVLHRVMQTTGSVNILLAGASGFGKTELAYQFSRMNSMNIFDVSCGEMVDPQAWFGSVQLREGETRYVASPLVTAIEAGNTVILLDEFSRTPPNVHNTLMALLDHRRAVELNDYDYKIVVPPDTVFIATVNLGYQYTGTFQVDAAALNRFDATILVDAPPSRIEQKIIREKTGIENKLARKIIVALTKLRGNDALGIDVSTRTALKIARLVVGGLPAEKAFQVCVVNNISDVEDHKPTIDTINHILFD